jgi:hypothetical protein
MIGRRTCATWAAPANPVQAGTSTALIVRRARPWPVLTAEVAVTAAMPTAGSPLTVSSGGHAERST